MSHRFGSGFPHLLLGIQWFHLRLLFLLTELVRVRQTPQTAV